MPSASRQAFPCCNMKRFRKVYLEISNRCNLSCAFCPGTKRRPGTMNEVHFAAALEKLRPFTDYLYFHLMGEPLCHPELEYFLAMAGQAGFRVILTTNGTLLPARQDMLLTAPALHKINISLHAFEANDLSIPFEQYAAGCVAFGQAARGQKIVVYRLWNNGGADSRNHELLQALHEGFPGAWIPGRRGTALADHVFLEPGDKFDWPDLAAPEYPGPYFCYGLRDQLGVLWDGTVVPCCLDHEGDIPLGNLFESDLEDILVAPRARALFEGFSRGQAAEPLCRRCGYASRFRGKNTQ